MIAQHLDSSLLIGKTEPTPKGTICSFTGKEINIGVKNKLLIKKTFTDHTYLRYKSEYSSVYAALCISPVIQGQKSLNALRNYSFICTKKEIRLLSREDILPLIENPPNEPFLFCVTYSHKKHLSCKSVINIDNSKYVIVTDLGNVHIDMNAVNNILPIIKKWYSVLPDKKDTNLKPTFFTKKEILQGCNLNKKIKAYGISKFFKEDDILKKYRNTSLLKLLVHCLNKTL